MCLDPAPSPSQVEQLRRLLQETAEGCASAEATLWMLAADDGMLVAVANAGPKPEDLEGLQIPVEGSLVGMVLSTGMPMAAGPDAAYHPAADAATGVRTQAMAAAPVSVFCRAVGVLSTINPSGRDLFGAGDLDRVCRDARLAGQLMERMRHGA